jgi:hypothetical protein
MPVPKEGDITMRDWTAISQEIDDLYIKAVKNGNQVLAVFCDVKTLNEARMGLIDMFGVDRPDCTGIKTGCAYIDLTFPNQGYIRLYPSKHLKYPTIEIITAYEEPELLP